MQNVRGVRTKSFELRKTLAVSIHRHDIIVLTETWLYDGISDPELGYDTGTQHNFDLDNIIILHKESNYFERIIAEMFYIKKEG